MQSNIRVFMRNNLFSKDVIKKSLLPFEKFELYYDVKKKCINKERGEYFVSRAEQYLEEEIPLLSLSKYREFCTTGVRHNFERVHHKRREALFYLAMAEMYENKGRFVEKAADYIWAILEETSWVIPAHYHHSHNDSTTTIPEVYLEEDVAALDLYVGATSSVLATVKYILEDKLNEISPVICKRIDYLIYNRAIRPFMVITPPWSGQRKGGFVNNWLTAITADVLNACALTVKDPYLRIAVVEKAMNYLDNFTASYPEDGYCDEGPGYWGGAAASLFDCLEIIEDMSGGKIQVYNDSLVVNMAEYIVRFNIEGNKYINFSDAAPYIEQNGKMIMRYGQKCASKSVESFGKRVAFTNPIDKNYFFGAAYRELKDSLLPEVKKAEPTLADTAVWFAENKIAIFRENPDTSRGLFMATKGGSNAESHNHNDVGCLVVYSDGKPVIIDPAYGSYNHGYFKAERYIRWYTNSDYHSVPSVDGKRELAGRDYVSSEEVCDLENKTVTMELKLAFARDAGIEKMQRTCTHEGKRIVVKDEVVLDHEGDIHFNFTTIDEPEILEPGKLRLAEGRTFSFDKGLTLDIEKIENKVLPYEDLNFNAHWKRECLWRIVLKTKGESAVSTVVIE